MLHLPRSDLRIFVGCGAAAAIAAAFNAPLAGAFYAFELIIGGYTLATLAPVGAAAVSAVVVTRALFGAEPIFVLFADVELNPEHYLVLAAIGVADGALAIAAMIGVTFVEQLSRRVKMPVWARPALGGLVLGAIALPFPQVLGSGHGGIEATIASSAQGFELPLLCGLIIAKLAASAVSIGTGFRGGMFSSSLYLGSLFGAAAAMVVHRLLPELALDDSVYILSGMGAVAAGVVGAPVTMILLALEATADFSATLGVTVAGADRRARRASLVRLLVRDLALPSARRRLAQPPRHRLAERSAGREADAVRFCRGAADPAARRIVPAIPHRLGPARIRRRRKRRVQGLC
jgi:CIC family chloride channel protein